MIELSYANNPEYYQKYIKCLEFLDSIKPENYEYPKEVTLFHIYTEVRTEKELECIKSFIATQNLDKCKLIVWTTLNQLVNLKVQWYLF